MSKFVGNLEKLFFDAWCNTNEDKRLYELWGDTLPNYTSTVLKGDNSITQIIASELGLAVHYEYYAHDAIFYDEELDPYKPSSEKNLLGNPNGNWLTRFRIAFEHENGYAGSNGIYQEVCHLLTTTADLKVLVTYPSAYGIVDDDKIKNSMDELSNLIKNSPTASPFLIIFGFLEEDKDNIVWRAWYREGYQFVELI